MIQYFDRTALSTAYFEVVVDGAPLIPGIDIFIAEADIETVFKKIDITVLGEKVELSVSTSGMVKK